MSVSKLFLTTITFIGLILFSGCGENNNNTSRPTAIGEAVYIVNSDPKITMAPAPSTLKSITSNIAKILEIDIRTENQKEATSFTKETRYCDVSGLKEFEYKGSLQKIKKLEKFDTCKNTKNMQNGYLTFNYSELNSEGKYPKIVNIIVKQDYTFNNILLKKGTTIDGQIEYNKNKSIKSISIKANGVVTYQYGTYKLINDQYTMVF